MTILIGGHETGLLDSSLLLLDRGDRTREGDPGAGEQIYVNVSNGNLVIQHTDAFLPSLGEDYALVRTYNSRGRLGDPHQHDDAGWTFSTSVRLTALHGAGGDSFEVEYGDGSLFDFHWDRDRDLYVSTEGAGAFETLEDLGVHRKNVPAYLLTRASGAVLAFDSQGRLLSATDTNGVRTRYVYKSDRLTRVFDDTGHAIDYVYVKGVLTRVEDELEGVLVQYVYSGGRLTEVIDRDGHRTRYEYTGQGDLSRIVLPSEQVVGGVRETYDARAISIEYEPVSWKQDTRAPEPAVTRIVDADGGVTTFDYAFDFASPGKSNRPPGPPGKPGSGGDKFFQGGVTRVVDALGNARAFSNEQQYVDWRVANGFYARYDPQQTARKESLRAQVDLIRSQQTLTYTFRENGYLTEVIDPQGFHTRYHYDGSFNLSSVTDRNGWGVTHSDSSYYRELRRDLGFVDSAGQGKSVAELTSDERDELRGLFTTRFRYDDHGNLLRRTDNEGHVTSFTYTDFDKVASSTSAMGNALVTSDDPETSAKRVELGFAAGVADLSDADQAALLALYTTRLEYDAHQNLVRRVDPGGDVTLFEYDASGNQTRQIVLLDPSITDPDAPSNADRVQITRLFYDAFGNNVRTVDALGNETRSEFDHFGNLLRFVDARGGVTLFTYDADNRLLSVTDPEGHRTSNAYDAVGNRISITDASGHTVLQLFDRNNLLIATLDPSVDGSADRLTQSSYDVVGNQTETTDAEGRTTTFVYDARHQVVEVITEEVAGPDGTTPTRYSTTVAYDGEGNRIRTTNARGFTTELVYTPDGLLRRTTEANGEVTQVRYDANHNELEIVAGLQLPIPQRRTRRFSYDEEDQVVRETDPLGGSVRTAYDAPGNVVSITDQNGHTTDFEYDLANRRVREIRPEVIDPVSGDPVRYVLEHRYDANGNQVETIDENGHATRFAFDRDDKQVLLEDATGTKTVFGYDSRENRTSVQIGVDAFVDADGKVVVTDADGAQVTTFRYDEFNQVIAIVDGVGNALATSDAPLYQDLRADQGFARLVADLSEADKAALRELHTSRSSYDRVGNQVAVTDNLGRTTTFEVDALDRLVRQADPLGAERRFSYDGVGNKVTETDERGNTNEFSYDAVDRLLQRSDPLLGVRSFSYDPAGSQATETDESGRTTTYLFDANERLVGQIAPLGNALVTSNEPEYLEARAALGIVDPSTGQGKLAEDLDASERQTLLDLHTKRTGYDAVGNETSETDENGHTTSFGYDANDRLVRQTSALGNTQRFRYDGAGNRIVDVDENGNTLLRAYDASNRPSALLTAQGFLTTYEYDAFGNEIVRNDYRQRYAPNPDGTIPAPAPGDVPRQTLSSYDANDDLTTLIDPFGSRTEFEYDAAGNVTAKLEGLPPLAPLASAPAAAPNAMRATTRRYDERNRVIEEEDALGVVTHFDLDKAGNVVARREAYGTANERVTTFEYDKIGRVTRETDALGNALVSSDAPEHLRARAELGYVDASTGEGKLAADLSPQERRAILDAYSTTFSYDASDRMLTRRSALGTPEERVESFEYDANGRLAAQVNGEGERTEFGYDAAGNRTRITVAPGTGAERVLGFEYDAENRLVAETDGEGIRTEYRYDAAGNKVETIQAAGVAGEERHTLYGYNADGQLVSVSTPTGWARAHSDAAEFQGWRVAHGYEANAAELSQADVASILARHTTTYEYDDLGNQFRITDADGTVTENGFDADGRVLVNVVGVGGAHGGIETENQYDALGNLVATTVSWADGTDARTTSYGYDALGRQTTVTDGEGFSSVIEYDEFGNQVSVRTGVYLPQPGDPGFDPAKAARARPQESRFVYDELDHVLRSTDGRGNAVENQYDAAGNRIAQTTGISGGTDPAHESTVHFEYDLANRLTGKRGATGGVVEIEYDEAGNQAAIRTLQSGTPGAADAVWVELGYRYDGNGRVVEETDSYGTRTAYRYDAVGNLLATVRAEGQAGVERQSLSRYDLDGNRIADADALGAVMGYETRYEVDAVGNRISQTDPEGNVTRFFYDEFHRLVGRVDPESYFVELVLDSAGNAVETRTYMQPLAAVPSDGSLPTPVSPDDVRIERETYDGASRRVRREFADGSYQTFARDSAGLLLEEKTFPSSDAEARSRTVDLAPRTLSWQWDASGRLVGFTNADGTQESYAYDAAGNRIRETVHDLSPLPGGGIDPDRTTLYSYDADNRVATQTNGPRVQSFSYDAAGNVVAKSDGGATTTSSYDLDNRLVSVTDPLGSSIHFGYDAVGNQTSLTDALGQTTDFAYDLDGRLVEEKGPELDAYTLEGGFASVRPTTTTSYDRLGNVLRTEDPNGFVTSRWYDGDGRVVAVLDGDFALREFSYDATGEVLSATRHEERIPTTIGGQDPHLLPLPPTGTAAEATVTNLLDARGRVIETHYPAIDVTTLSGTNGSSPTSSTASVAPVERSFYDAFGNLVESVDRNGNHSFGYYDLLGRQVAVVDPEGYLVETAYDSQGHVVQQRKYATALAEGSVSAGERPAPPSGDVFVVDRVYDASGRLVSETSPPVETESGGVRVETTYAYDAVGNQVSKTLAAGSPEATTEYHYYDAANRERAVVTANRVLNVFDYDGNGNLIRQERFIDPVPGSVDLASASLDALLASVTPDAAGDEITEYGYNSLNLLESQTDRMGPGSSDDLERLFAYDAAGNLTREQDEDGFVVQNAYDAAGHVTTTIAPNGGVSQLEYDTAGLKVRSWTGGAPGTQAPTATNVGASVTGGASATVSVSWDVTGSGITSWVAWDVVSHEVPSGSVPSGGPGIAGVYAFASGAAGSGAGESAALPVPPSAGTLYFRVMSRDAAGNLAWTAERSVPLPPRVSAFSATRVGAGYAVLVSFSAAVTSPTLVPDSGTPVAGDPSGLPANSFRFALPVVADPTAFAFHLSWSAGGTSFTTNQGTFLEAPGEHAPLGSEGVVSWPVPDGGTGPVGDTQLMVLDGLALPDASAIRASGNELQFDPQLGAEGIYAYEAFYGTRRPESHQVGVSFSDTQSTQASFVHYLDANGDVTSDVDAATQSVWDLAWQSDDDGLVATTITASFADTELANVGPGGLQVAYRTAQSGADFASQTALSGDPPTAVLQLAENTSYDLKVFYLDADGREVIVEWQRITVPAEAVSEGAGQVTVDGTAAPATSVRQQPVGSPVQYSGSSLTVLASETGGRIHVDPSLAVTRVDPGAYSGPIDPGGTVVALPVETTHADPGNQSSDGLSSETYFTEIEYNRIGAKIASNEDTGVWRRYGVDANGNVVETRSFGTQEAEAAYEAGTPGNDPIVTYAAYDARNLEVADFGPSVAAGRAVTRTSYDYARRLSSVLEPGGSTTRLFEYDGVGNLISEAYAGSGILVGQTLLAQVRSLRYDRLGRLVSETDARSNVRRKVYGATDADPTERGRLVQEFVVGLEDEATTYGYDAFGRVTSITDGLGNRQTRAYDQRDRLTEVVDAIGNSTPDPADGITRTFYDGRNHQTWVQDANGNFFGRAYDGLGLVTHEYSFQERQADGFVHAAPASVDEARAAVADASSPFRSVLVDRATGYDVFANKISETDAEGRRRFFSYGAFGRLVSDAIENGLVTEYAYDRFGNRVLETSSAGRRVETSYDAANRPTEVDDVGTSTIASYAYDLAGRLASEQLTIGGAVRRNVAYQYYDNGWLRHWKDSAPSPDIELSYEYDGNGNRLLVVGSNTSDEYSYDAANRVLTHDGDSYGYDAAGQRKTFTSGGTTTTYGYDADGRVTSASGGQNIEWSYDAVGNVTQVSDGGKVTNNEFDTDNLNWRTQDVDAGQTTETRFDRSGRVIQTIVTDASDANDVKTYTYTYEYSLLDGLQTAVKGGGTGSLAGTSSSTYDVNRRLVGLDLGQDETKSFSYDTAAHIVSRVDDDGGSVVTTSFLYALGVPVGEYTDAATPTLNAGAYTELENIAADPPFPDTSVTEVTVLAGDTLRAIADRVYGNPNLWFVIAEANGLGGSEPLQAGERLLIPNTVENGRLSFETHALYDEGAIVGSKLPNLAAPPPPQPSKCAVIAAIILIVVVAIVAIALTIVTVGAAAPAAVAALGLTAGSVGAILVTVAVGAVIGAAIAFAASVVTQGILVGFGLQQEFDWKAVASDTVAGAFGGAAAGLGSALSAARAASTAFKVVNVVGQTALEAAGETARQAIQYDGRIEQPWAIALAGAGAGFGAVASNGVRAAKAAKAADEAADLARLARAPAKARALLGVDEATVQQAVKATQRADDLARAARAPAKARALLGLNETGLARFRAVFKQEWARQVEEIGGEIRGAAVSIRRGVVSVGELATSAFASLKQGVVSAGESLTSGLQKLRRLVAGISFASIKRGVVSAGEAVTSGLQKLRQAVKGLFAKTEPVVEEAAKVSTLAKIKAALQEAGEAALSGLKAAGETAFSGLRALGRGAKAAGKAALEAFGETTEEKIGNIGRKLVVTPLQIAFDNSTDRKSLYRARTVHLGAGTGGLLAQVVTAVGTDVVTGLVAPLANIKAREALLLLDTGAGLAFESKKDSVWVPILASLSPTSFDDTNARSSYADLHASQHSWLPTSYEDAAAVSTTQVFSAFDLDRAASLGLALASNRLVSGQVAAFDPEAILAFAERSVGGVDGRFDQAPVRVVLLDPQPPNPLVA